MTQNWTEELQNLVTRIDHFNEVGKPISLSVHNLEMSAQKNHALDGKTHELIALAVAVTTKCDGCISIHASAARKKGATKEEVVAALGTAVALNAGAAYVYSTRALEAFNEQ